MFAHVNAAEVATKYARDVIGEKIVAGKLQQLACARFLDDLKHAHKRGLRFDPAAAQRPINFLCRLKHIKGIWDNPFFVPSPWQVFCTANLFGWLKENGYRRFREAYIEVGRKNGKSTWVAGLGLYLFSQDKEPGAQIYSAATTLEQAREVFITAAEMVKKDERLSERIQITGKTTPTCLFVLDTSSRFKPLPYEGSGRGSGDGKNASGAILDELHQHPDSGQFDLLNQALLSRKQGMLIAITTAGKDKHGVCFHVRERHEKILAGIFPAKECDSVFSFICCIDEGDENNWDDERLWCKANPNMDVSFDIDDLRKEAYLAKQQPSALGEFKRKHLCFWTTSDTPCIDSQAWAKCNAAAFDSAGRVLDWNPIELRKQALKEFEHENVFAGLDLSQKNDLSCLCLVAPPKVENAPWKLLPFFWMPLMQVDTRVQKDKIEYDEWIQQGFVETTPGDMIDYSFIRKKVNELNHQYHIQELAYDPWDAQMFKTELDHDGVKVVECRQGYRTLSGPTKDFLAMIPARKIEHYGNPVLSWMAGNLIVIPDPAGNLKPDKGHVREKIDGIVAALCGMWSAGQHPIVGPSVYSKRGIVFI